MVNRKLHARCVGFVCQRQDHCFHGKGTISLKALETGRDIQGGLLMHKTLVIFPRLYMVTWRLK